MRRVTELLERFGASFSGARSDRLPLLVRGSRNSIPVQARLNVPSAQVKSAFLLAALQAPGISEIVEPIVTRDHTERMLRCFGAKLQILPSPDNRRHKGADASIDGRGRIRGSAHITVPRDPSSAAFLVGGWPMLLGFSGNDAVHRIK